MEPLNQEEIQATRQSTYEDSGYFQRVDTTNMKEAVWNCQYSDCLINSATRRFTKFTDKQGREVTMEWISLQLIYTHPNSGEKYKLKAEFNVSSFFGRERAIELINLFKLTDNNGLPNFKIRTVFTKDGKEIDFVDDLPGRHVDVVIDNMKYRGGYLNNTVRGFFLKGRSWQEIAHNIPLEQASEIALCRQTMQCKFGTKAEKEDPFKNAPAFNQPVQEPINSNTSEVTKSRKTKAQKEQEAQANFYKQALADDPAPKSAPEDDVPF